MATRVGEAAGSAPPSALLLAFPGPGFAPFDELAGLSLVTRAVLTLQKAGLERIRVIGPREVQEPFARARDDARIHAELDFVACASRNEALGALDAGPDQLLLVSSVEDVVAPAIYRALREAKLGDAVAVAARDGEHWVGPFLTSGAGLAALSGDETRARIAELAADGKVAPLDVGKAWHARADGPAGRTRAVYLLFEACRKPVDGLVSRHLNRHVSIFISKRLVSTPVTPNQMSLVTFVLGVAGAFAVSRGGYLWSLLGAVLFQWNSILDGVDGELARVRFQHSKLGQWVDTVCDDVSNVIFYIGLAFGASGLAHGQLLASAGWIAAGATLLTMAQYYVELVRIGSGDFYALSVGVPKSPGGFVGAVVGLFERVLKKDFFIFLFLCMAVAGVLPYATVLAAFGASIALGSATVRNVRRLAA